jgi:C4-dicarboxylate-binding protein DctP
MPVRKLGVATLLALAAGPLGAQQFTMKISSPTVNDVTQEWMKAFKAGVESRAGGKIKVEMYPANQLGQIPATVEGTALGTIEMTNPATGFLIGLDPRFQVFDAPGLFDDTRHAARVLSDETVRKRFATLGNAKGVEPLILFAHGPMGLASHRAIRTIADFKGQKIRTPGGAPLHMEPFRRLGAIPVSLPFGETLPALQNKTIDGMIATVSIYSPLKYYDVVKPLTVLPGSFLVVGGVVNRNWMKSLGPDLERIVREEARKAESVFTGVGPEQVQASLRTWESNKGEVITMAPAESERFVKEVTGALGPILEKNASLKEDYEALLAAAKRARQ